MNRSAIFARFYICFFVLGVCFALVANAQTTDKPIILELDKPIERELAGDQVHSYSIALTAGQYLYVVVDQRGIDVVVSLFGPDGRKLIEVDSPNYWRGPEPLSMTAETTGNYRLEVRSSEKTALAGRYEARIVELRAATEKDKTRFVAEQAFSQAQQLETEGTAPSLQSALNKYEEALRNFRAIGDLYRGTLTIYYMGRIFMDLGYYQKALDNFFQTLPFIRLVKYVFGEAEVLNDIGWVYYLLGETQKALDYYEQALPLRDVAGDVNGRAATLNNIGVVYSSLGEKKKALDYYKQSLPLLRSIRDRINEGNTLGNIGRVYFSLGEKKKALEYHEQALLLQRAEENHRGEANMLAEIGTVYDSLGDKKKALDYFTQALSLSRTVGDRDSEATTLNNIGSIYDESGEKQKAYDYYSQALALYRAIESRNGEAGTLFNLAVSERDTNNFTESLKNIETSLVIVESLRTKIGRQTLRSSYFATVQKYHELYIHVLMQLHKQKPSEGYDAKAFQASERARARGLIELLTEASTDIRQGVDEKLLETERNLRQRISARTDARIRLLNSKHTQEQEDKINKEIKELTDEYEKIEAQIRTTSPRYAALAQPQPLTLTDIQKKVLDRDTILLEYALGAERSYLWVVTQEAIYSYELPKRETINDVARAFYKSISTLPTATTKKEYATSAQTLSDILLKPAVNHLQNNKRLLIVGDGVLQYIPFAALPSSMFNVQSSKSKSGRHRTSDSGQPLIAEHEIICLPSASTLAVLRDEKNIRPKNAKEIIVVADPVFESSDLRLKSETKNDSSTVTNKDRALQSFLRTLNNETTTVESAQPIPRLSFTRREALVIAALVPKEQSKIYLDFDANYVNATNADVGQYRFIHFATHGLLNSERPELTGILFSMIDENRIAKSQSLLRLGEVYNLKLPVEMVVLSACQTALGKDVRGEGLVGLTRGFMYAGSPRVVASLWRIEDAATAQLMKEFYKGIFADRLPPAKALQKAQLAMIKNGYMPFYWAAFTIQGEWK